jgi:excisionase family DNA binding protein
MSLQLQSYRHLTAVVGIPLRSALGRPEGPVDWLTLNEAASYLKVKPRTLAAWVNTGKVPGHRLSGTRRYVWRFLQSELDAMLIAETPSGSLQQYTQTSPIVTQRQRQPSRG